MIRRTRILDAAVATIAHDGVRGLRIEKLAAEAGVSTALIYYHFTDRAGVLRAALEHVNHRAQNYTGHALAGTDAPRDRLEQMLMLELQDDEQVRANSVAWGELRASAVFDRDLRASLDATTRAWNDDVRDLVEGAAGTGAPHLDAASAAEHLTALVEGLSERWHSGSIGLERAREILARAIDLELSVPPP